MNHQPSEQEAEALAAGLTRIRTTARLGRPLRIQVADAIGIKRHCIQSGGIEISGAHRGD